MDESVADDLIAKMFRVVFIGGLLEIKEMFENCFRATHTPLMCLNTGGVLLKI